MEAEEIYNSVKQFIQKNGSLKISNIEMNRDGFNNDIAMLKLIDSKNGEKKELVLKSFQTTARSDLRKAKFYKELAILKNEAISKVIHIPRIYFYDEEKQIILMERIEGITFDKKYLMNPKEMTKTFQEFGATLAHIHSIGLETFDFDHKDLGIYINSLRNRAMAFNEPKYLYILEALAERLNGIQCDEVLNHGDFHFQNIIVNDDTGLCVLDWEKAQIADYRYDLANTFVAGYSWFGVDFKKQMLAGYEAIAQKNIAHLDCFIALLSFDSFTKTIPLIEGGDDAHIRDRTFEWLKRRYELFVKYNGIRIKEAEDFLLSKGLLLTV